MFGFRLGKPWRITVDFASFVFAFVLANTYFIFSPLYPCQNTPGLPLVSVVQLLGIHLTRDDFVTWFPPCGVRQQWADYFRHSTRSLTWNPTAQRSRYLKDVQNVRSKGYEIPAEVITMKYIQFDIVVVDPPLNCTFELRSLRFTVVLRLAGA